MEQEMTWLATKLSERTTFPQPGSTSIKVSFIQRFQGVPYSEVPRCPLFRGFKVSLIQRFQGVPYSEVPLSFGFHCAVLHRTGRAFNTSHTYITWPLPHRPCFLKPQSGDDSYHRTYISFEHEASSKGVLVSTTSLSVMLGWPHHLYMPQGKLWVSVT